ncbi:sigma-70 region 4 domain-containing protein [uncultured Sphingomonas sp.]|uniref:sigma-70 region 4 domain-containing protein n=1 Tax=uncultured Sphingomonas sp. TaxID=158754 RepID=UPI0025E75C04|nr:sigma-70 region 4 domain-containing protein [uncultured Sphingomonas sp.]
MKGDRGEGERTFTSLGERGVAALAGASNVENTPITSAELAKMEAAVRSLRRRDREIYLAHRLDDMSYAAIAEATDLSVAQVKRAMARAIIGINRHLRGAPPRRRWWLS